MLNSLLTAIITVALGWASIWVKNKLTRAERGESERDRMTREAFEKMLCWHSEHLSEKSLDDETFRNLGEMSRRMAVWAPDRVLVEYAAFLEKRNPGPMKSIDPHEAHFGAAILAFRRELGFKNRWGKVKPEHVAVIFKAGWARSP